VAWRVHGVLDIVSNWAVKFFGVSFDSLMLYRAEEWEQLLKKGIFVSEKVIEEREELTIFVLNKEGVVEYRGEEAKELKLNIFLLRMLNLARLKSF
jgi:hydrogenase maturation factor HypE